MDTMRRTSLILLALAFGLAAADWPDWRGPNRDGTSAEKGLPTKWSPQGENLAWRVPYGSRSAPVVFGNRVYLQNWAGKGPTLQERIMAFDADTGRIAWEYKFNVYQSDVPAHRVGWASPVVDTSSGNVYAFGVGASVVAVGPDGKALWHRSLAEDLGMVTTHGGRTMSPVIVDDLVIVSGVTSQWGAYARANQRFIALDKKTGETVWVNSPGLRPYDTTYSPPAVATVNGVRMLIAGGGDGAVHAMKPLTGEPIWRFEMAKRGINTGVVVYNNAAIVSHSEENLDTSEMGMLAAIDATAKGDIKTTKWAVKGVQNGFSSPIIDGDRLLQVDNGANLYAYDINTGKQLWKQNMGTIQKASPVLADGKIYVGSENGRFFILKPHNDHCEVLDQDWLGTEAQPEIIIASPAVSNGRVFVASMDALYAIGPKKVAYAKPTPPVKPAASTQPAAYLRLWPTEVITSPGAKIPFKAAMFDANGEFIRGVPVPADLPVAPVTKFTADGLTGEARVRVIPPLPWSNDFNSATPGPPPPAWVNATGKFQVRKLEDGNTVLVKLADNPFTKRARAYMGPSNWSNYTVEADVLATEKRRQMGDGGVIAQRHALVLFGNHQRLELQPWQPETERTVAVPFAWKSNTWYRLKLRVENVAGGVRARGKAWLASDPEPAEWLIDRTDPIGNREGSPGVYADAPFEVFLDNLKVQAN